MPPDAMLQVNAGLRLTCLRFSILFLLFTMKTLMSTMEATLNSSEA